MPMMFDSYCVIFLLNKIKNCQNFIFSGADLSALVREASLNAIRNNVKHNWNIILPHEEKGHSDIKVTCENFNNAFFKVSPSISKKVLYFKKKQ